MGALGEVALTVSDRVQASAALVQTFTQTNLDGAGDPGCSRCVPAFGLHAGGERGVFFFAERRAGVCRMAHSVWLRMAEQAFS